jgi:hypothetical protein
LGNPLSEHARSTSSKPVSHDKERASVHSFEQRYIFWRKTFCLKGMEESSMVDHVESILDIKV